MIVNISMKSRENPMTFSSSRGFYEFMIVSDVSCRQLKEASERGTRLINSIFESRQFAAELNATLFFPFGLNKSRNDVNWAVFPPANNDINWVVDKHALWLRKKVKTKERSGTRLAIVTECSSWKSRVPSAVRGQFSYIAISLVASAI